MKKQNERLKLFSELVVKERDYLSREKRLEILQFRWGIVGGRERTFRDINRLTNTKNSKEVYRKMMDLFEEKKHIFPEAVCGVYFVRGEIITHLIKVGSSINSKNRVRHLQTGSADKLHVEYTIPVKKKDIGKYEHKVHKWLDEWKDHDEWFRIPDQELELLYVCRSEEDLEALFKTNELRMIGLDRKKGEDDPLEDDNDYSEKEVEERMKQKRKEQGRYFTGH